MTTPNQASGHAPGWSWRKDFAGNVNQPWESDRLAQTGGLCQHGWHGDCPQAPLIGPAGAGQCDCVCHTGRAS